ncbi:MAG: hypothetical protein ABSC56_13295 [Solirubrobacteraceae bacterium]|jgi:predicted hotdog family 3-hydroxylacyl-ACP dehydratase
MRASLRGQGRRALLAAVVAVLALAANIARADVDPDPTNVTGSLIAGGELSGTVAIDFLANASATYTATLSVDGNALVSAQVLQGAGQLSLDTTQLVDGDHSVLVTVTDGATTATVWSGTIETLNAPQGGAPAVSGTPAIGATLTASPGSWTPAPTAIAYQWQRCTPSVSLCTPIAGANGASYQVGSADADSQLEVQVLASNANGTAVATSAPTAPVASGAGASASTGAGASSCSDPQLIAQLAGHATETVALGAGATLEGELECAGSGIGGATLELAIAAPSATAQPSYASVQTGADGSFSYTLPAGPSRDVTLSYRSDPNATQPAALASVALLVRPRITLAITPRTTTNHHTITFSGRVYGGHIAAGGLPLQLEYLEGRRWMIYTDVRAGSAGGRYSYRYTFERTTESITYTFRVAIPASGVSDYPYEPVASAPASVHVSP